MTVAGLIEKLKTFRQDLPVCLYDDYAIPQCWEVDADNLSVRDDEYVDSTDENQIGEFLQIG